MLQRWNEYMKELFHDNGGDNLEGHCIKIYDQQLPRRIETKKQDQI